MLTIKELKYGNTRCFCINDTVMVDTDWAGTLPAFYKCIKENNIELSRIKYLFITHFHPDHMGIAQDLAEHGIKIVVFEEQKEYIHCSDKVFEKEKGVQFKPIADEEILLLSCGESRKFLAGIGISGEVIHTVGHSEDSISVILDDGIAIVGDLYPLDTVPAYKNERLEKSWNRILSYGIKVVYYGHAKGDFLGEQR